MLLRRVAHVAVCISCHCNGEGHYVMGSHAQDVGNFGHAKVTPIVVSFHLGQAEHLLYKAVKIFWATDSCVVFLRGALTNFSMKTSNFISWKVELLVAFC